MKCHDCGATQLEGTLFCSECGRFLMDTAEQSTVVLPFSEFEHNSPPPPLVGHELIPAEEPCQITLVIPSSRRRLTIELKDQIRIGRADATLGMVPELDLTEDGAAEKGVSRMHAVIQFSNKGIILVDLGSTNGTLLNNYRLPAELPYLVQDGDEIHFGDLLVHLFVA
ncbi:MAG: FHA domain-containing protein [Anaerolineae bacterium]